MEFKMANEQNQDQTQTTKNWYHSKTIILNFLQFILLIAVNLLQNNELMSFLKDYNATYYTIAVLVLNVLLRFKTDTAIK